MTQICILNERNRNGCASCSPTCPHKISLNGLNGKGGRIALAGAPASYRHLTLSNSPARESQSKAYGLLEKYIATFQRMFDADGERIKSLYLFSANKGTGKTTSACAVMNEYIIASYLGAMKRGLQPTQQPTLFFDITSIQARYNMASMADDKPTIHAITQDFLKACRAEFLVVDDIGRRAGTPSFNSLLFMLVNERTSADLPTIYTANVPISELETLYDGAIMDRVRDQCAVIAFEGESKRGRR